MIVDRIIDRVGEGNPQLFRELKERLTSRNLGLTVIISLLIQGFTYFYLNSQIPAPNLYTLKNERTHKLCISIPPNNNGYNECHLNTSGGFDINWQAWWADIFMALSWILPLGLILGSVYLLVADLVREEKRGTLNFIRLSPQSLSTIAIGKIFGVPILVYLAAILMVPFHLWAGIQAGGNLILIGSWYLVIGSIWYLLSSAAILYVLLGGVQAILTVVAVGFPLYHGPITLINNYTSATLDPHSWLRALSYENARKISWFFLPISSRSAWLNIFISASCFLATYWVWQALERRYLNPTATVISKPQSYLLNLCIQIWVAGFAIPVCFIDHYQKEDAILAIAMMDLIGLLCFIPLLLPTKQAVQDWSRYRRERVNHAPRKFWQRELLQDLINHEKSPALLAMVINLGMALILCLPLSLISLMASRSHGIRFIGGLCIGTTLILLYTAIAHWCLFLNVKKQTLWVISVTGGTIFLPVTVAFILSHNSQPTGFAAILLLFSPLAPAGIINLPGSTVLFAFIAQLSLLTGFTRQLQRKIQIAGQSQTKKLA
jgi:hypothetical protein